ncbi:MAG TPA: hypothetical protein VHJ59_02090 [Nitrososphaera sp.]|nr:hypothetical protein [Nitrososphaera sp.]
MSFEDTRLRDCIKKNEQSLFASTLLTCQFFPFSKQQTTITTRIDIKEENGSHNITARVGNFGEIKSQQLRNEAGRAMTVQGASFASMFQFENDVLTLAPSGTQWSDSDTPHTQITTRSRAVGKFSWRGN